ncbi:MAG: arsenic efflux protein [Acidaminococcaceae bacterium]|nr:arsenic efflux protein [Acidaminococcaceae bacterium]
MQELLTDVCVDTLKLYPFLFFTYLFMEYLETRSQERTIALLRRCSRSGPVLGALLGVLPQCGFSVASASLFAGGVISAGTLLAVFLSTSDEMLPVFLAESVPLGTVAAVLGWKVLFAAVTGFAAHLFFPFRAQGKREYEERMHSLCEWDHCCCEEGNIVKSALHHSLSVAFFVFLISFLCAAGMEMAGEETIASLFGGNPVTGTLAAALIGLIPNCAASVLIAELYLKGILGAGQLMAGLLTGSGAGLLVLFRSNRRLKENLRILAFLYAAGVFWGLLFQGLSIRI